MNLDEYPTPNEHDFLFETFEFGVENANYSSYPAARADLVDDLVTAALVHDVNPTYLDDELIDRFVRLSMQQRLRVGDLNGASDEVAREFETEARQDYLSALGVAATNTLFSYDVSSGESELMHGNQDEHQNAVAVLTALSDREITVESSLTRFVGITREALAQSAGIADLVGEAFDAIRETHKQPRTPERDTRLNDQYNELGHMIAQMSRSFPLVHSTITHATPLLETYNERSAVREYLSEGDNSIVLKAAHPTSSNVSLGWPDKHFDTYLANWSQRAALIPRFNEVASGYLDAAEQDIRLISNLVDRQPNESSDEYMRRLQESTKIDWSEDEIALMSFVRENEDEIYNNPALLLAQIGGVVGVELKPVERSLHSDAISSLVDHMSNPDMSEPTGEDAQKGTPNIKVYSEFSGARRDHVLVMTDTSDTYQEINYVTGTSKSIVDAANRPLDLHTYGPFNVLTDEQMDRFNRAIAAINYAAVLQ